MAAGREMAFEERLLGLAGVGGFVYDPEAGRYLRCSPALAVLHGLTVEAFLAEVRDLEGLMLRIHPEDRAAYRAAVDRLVAKGRSYEVDYRLVADGGACRHVRETAERLDGGPCLIGCVREVELAGELAAASAENARLHGAFEALMSGVAIFDAEGRLAYFNRRYRELMAPSVRPVLRVGERFEDIIATAFVEGPVYHPEMGADFFARRLELQRAGAVDQEIRLADGRWLRVRENPLPDGGRVILTADVSERKAVEAALRDSEARLAAFMEHAPVGMQVKDTDGRFVLVNPAFCRMTERTPEALLRRTLPEAFPDEDVAPVVELEREILATGRADAREEQFRSASGRDQWRLAIRFPVRDAEGRITHVGGFRIDITEQKAIEERLRASEQRFRVLSEAHPVPLAIAAVPDGRILYASPPLGELLGVPHDRLIGTRSGRFWVEPAARERLIQRLRRRGFVNAEEVRLRRADGSEIVVAFTSRLITFEDQEAMISGLTDLADKKRAEATDLLLRAVIDAVPGVIHVKDRALRYQLANRYYLDQWGLEPGQLIGRTQQEVFREQLAFAWSRATDDRDARVVATGAPTGFYEVRVPVKGGRDMVLWANKTPLKDEEGEVTHVLTVGTDITALKQAEEEIARHREALHQSEKLNALGSMLASVAHELNNPLSVVLGYATMMDELATDTATRDRAARVRAAAERCARIVRTFLAMARQKPEMHGPVQLNALVEGAIEIAGYGLRSLGIEVALELDAEVDAIPGDADQLTLVLMNLIVNAQQALQTASGPRRIRIRTGRDDGAARLEVEDNGPGIPPSAAERIFEPFFTTKPEGTGTGIGLSVCRRIVDAHGGEIEVAGGAGGGALFRVRLPVGTVDGAPPDAASLPAGGRQRARILVVDDEPEVRQLLVEILERRGYTVETAAGGREALETVTARRVDLIICDLRMPDLDGPGLYRALAERRPDLLARLVFITGASLAADLDAFLEQTGAAVIEKPFDPQDVLCRVQGWLDALAPAPAASP